MSDFDAKLRELERRLNENKEARERAERKTAEELLRQEMLKQGCMDEQTHSLLKRGLVQRQGEWYGLGSDNKAVPLDLFVGEYKGLFRSTQAGNEGQQPARMSKLEKEQKKLAELAAIARRDPRQQDNVHRWMRQLDVVRKLQREMGGK